MGSELSGSRAWNCIPYSGSSYSRISTSPQSLPISTGFWMGPSIWSSSVFLRPFQNWLFRRPALYTVGALISPSCPSIPMETCRPSAPPPASMWQLAQETVPSRESFGSMNSARPSAIRAGSSGGEGGTGAIGSAPAAARLPPNPAPIAPKSITARITVAPVPSVRTAPPVLPPSWLRLMDANARPDGSRTVPRIRQRVFRSPGGPPSGCRAFGREYTTGGPFRPGGPSGRPGRASRRPCVRPSAPTVRR